MELNFQIRFARNAKRDFTWVKTTNATKFQQTVPKLIAKDNVLNVKKASNLILIKSVYR